MKKVKKNFKKKLIIMEKSDPYLIRYHNSNSFIRAKELIPDYGDDENTKDKYTGNAYFNTYNITRGFYGVYPFNEILSCLTSKQRTILFYQYIDNLDFKEIAKKLNIPFKRVKYISKQAHRHFISILTIFKEELG